jgi:capsule polysaccharide export protein KpsE/RkpR
VAEKEGLISIAVEDRDAGRAAALANGYVEELHAMNSELAISEAGQRRVFYEDKVNAERDALAIAEVQLKQAQEKTGLLQPDAQARVIIQSVADMRAQVALREVQIEAMRTYATKDNPDLHRAEQELAGLRAQLVKMELARAERMALKLVLSDVPGATPKKPASGLMA